MKYVKGVKYYLKGAHSLKHIFAVYYRHHISHICNLSELHEVSLTLKLCYMTLHDIFKTLGSIIY